MNNAVAINARMFTSISLLYLCLIYNIQKYHLIFFIIFLYLFFIMTTMKLNSLIKIF